MGNNLTRIEKHFEKKDEKGQFWPKYETLRKELFEKEYQFVMSYFKGGNEHGVGHVLRVLERLWELLDCDALHKLNIYELYILLSATIYHDIGLLKGRTDHEVETRRIIELEGDVYVTRQKDREFIKLIAEAHSSSQTIDDVFVNHPSEPERVANFDLRHKYLSALLRLADELDEDFRRADERVRNRAEIPEESEIFWVINSRITGIKVDHSENIYLF